MLSPRVLLMRLRGKRDTAAFPAPLRSIRDRMEPRQPHHQLQYSERCIPCSSHLNVVLNRPFQDQGTFTKFGLSSKQPRLSRDHTTFVSAATHQKTLSPSARCPARPAWIAACQDDSPNTQTEKFSTCSPLDSTGTLRSPTLPARWRWDIC